MPQNQPTQFDVLLPEIRDRLDALLKALSSHPSIRLSAEEVAEITRYKRACDQLPELHRRGFHRAYIGRDGVLVLERAHYEAVCQGKVELARPRATPLAARRKKADTMA